MPQFQIQFDPVPNPAAIVLGPKVRFSVLTSRLIRMEYSPNEMFEDHASQAFWFRKQPVPAFQAQTSDEGVEIETDDLRLTYKVNPRGFIATSLQITVKSTGHTWYFGQSRYKSGNLGGTYRTLDETAGSVHLDPGLVAQSGAAAYDDSKSLVFNDQGWLEARANPDNQDIYFFGYGHDYEDCLQEFCQVSGRSPMIPRYILGNWWSRYWAYTDEELLGLMDEFKDHDVPLSVCIVDMDWHITDTGNTSTGWTGYTWNRELYPDPAAFLDELHTLGLRTALNLHPAEGVHPHEEAYPALAEFLGLDPNSEDPIPFNIADPKFAQGYFEILHHPMEAMGVDFWWIDWQQGELSSLPGLDPLWWLNHLHYHDLGRDGRKRPFVFSRWGGLGNHRYPIGFSGDTVIGWDALDFQPGFTSTAANVGYGWWSHYIGGHMSGIEDDELYARWTQYGVFSPILRLHCTNNPFHERRPWKRGPAAERAIRAAMRLRHRLIPYIYTMAWRNHQKSIPLVTPTYYTHPKQEETYTTAALHTYWFGGELLAAPFTQAAHPETGLSRVKAWLPEGEWFDFFSGEALQGGGWREVYGTLDDIPVFARAGAIVPLAVETPWSDVSNPETLQVLVFPGADKTFELYEDDGETTGYLQGEYALTKMETAWREDSLSFTIHPVSGDSDLVPGERRYVLKFRSVAQPADIVISLNDSAIDFESTYHPETETLELTAVTMKPSDRLTVTLRGNLTARRERTMEKLSKFLFNFRLESWEKATIYKDWGQIASGELSLQRYQHLSEAQMQVLESLIANL
jgi:alpha-glucosidase (family GH31 glycosyl hydrolase)